MQQEKIDDIEISKMILLGDTSTGKTSFLKNYISNQKTKATLQTKNLECLTALNTNPRKYVQIWDTPGQQKYRLLPQSIISQFQYAIIFYDVTNMHTFIVAKKMLSNITSYYPMIKVLMIGNKLDVVQRNPTKREVELAQVREFCSSKKIQNIEFSFQERSDKIIQKLLEQKMPFENGSVKLDLPVDQKCSCL